MIKFFRKHTKKLLAVFMGLLLIVWLGGSALQSMMSTSASGSVYANTAFGDIIELDRQIANSQTNLLRSIGIEWRMPLFAFGQQEPLGVTEWILLAREAKRYGIEVRLVEAEQFLTNTGRTLGVQRVAKRDDVKVESIYDAVTQFIAIRTLANMALSTGLRSEAEVRVAARDELEKVKINLVSLRAATFEDSGGDFSDAELEAQFDAYRDQESEGGLKFGYMQTAAVKVQYFEIDLEKVAANVRVGDRTLETQAKDYWRKNRTTSQFRRPPEPVAEEAETTEESDNPEESSDETTVEEAEPEQPKSPYFETFEEARDEAVKAVRLRFASKEIDEVAGWLLRQMSEPWYGALEGDDGYKIGSPDVVAPGFCTALLERLPAGLRYGNAVSIQTTEYFTNETMSQVAPLLAQSRIPRRDGVGSVRVFRNMVFHTQGVESMPTQPGVASTGYTARGQVYPQHVTTVNGNRCVFRVIDVKPAGPPSSMDEIRDQVVADLRTKRGYGEAERLAERLHMLIGDGGLKSAFDGDDELTALVESPSGYYQPALLSRRRQGSGGLTGRVTPIYVSGVGLVEDDFIEQCFALGDGEGQSKFGVIPVESAAAVVVVEWIRTDLLRRDTYEAEHQRLASQIGRSAMTKSVGEWLDPVRIRDRNGFAFATP